MATLLEEALDMPITRHGAYGNSSDGVPVNSAMSGGFDGYSLDMNNIERIEVIYGGSDSAIHTRG